MFRFANVIVYCSVETVLLNAAIGVVSSQKKLVERVFSRSSASNIDRTLFLLLSLLAWPFVRRFSKTMD